MKKFVLSALGALGLSGFLSAAEPTTAPKKETPVAPTVCVDANDHQEARRGGFQFGVGMYYIKPFWESNTALTTSTQTIIVTGTTINATTTSGTQDFDHNYTFAPRVFAGYVSECGLGIRLGWWRIDDNATASTTVTAVAPGGTTVTTVSAPGLGSVPNTALPVGSTGTFSLNNSIEMNVFDLDITQRLLDNDRWNLTVGGGVRYMEIDQAYNGSLTFTGLPGGAVIRSGVATRNEFDAVGPNLLLDAKRRLGDSGLGLYASGRFGVLFGDSRQENITNNFQSVGVNTVTISSTNVVDREDLIPFLDVESGVQWQGCGNLKPFGRLGVTGQNYFGVGNGSLTSTNTNLGFLGLSATFGLSY